MATGANSTGWILWCGLGGLSYYPRPKRGGDLARFLDCCAAAGVAELAFYFGFAHAGGPTAFRLEWGERPFDPAGALATFELYEPGGWDPWDEMTSAARARGLRLTGYTSANYQGALQPNPHSPLGERVPFLFLSQYANRFPRYWSRDASGRDSLAREGYVILDLAHVAVGEHLAGELTGVANTRSLDSLELEWLCGSGESSPYGPPDRTEASAGITAFVHQVRHQLDPARLLSVAVDHDLERARAWFHDWPQWASAGLVQRVVLRHRGNDLAQLSERVQQARNLLPPEVELVSQLDCWRASGLRDRLSLAKAAETVLASGSNTVGIYRADAVEALDLWQDLGDLLS